MLGTQFSDVHRVTFAVYWGTLDEYGGTIDVHWGTLDVNGGTPEVQRVPQMFMGYPGCA